HTNLMRAAGLELEQQQRMMDEALQDTEVGARFPATSGGDCHLLTMTWIASNGRVDTSLIQGDNAFHQGQIALDHLIALHLCDQSCLSASVSGNDQQTRGVAIQTMYNTWSMASIEGLQIGIIG